LAKTTIYLPQLTAFLKLRQQGASAMLMHFGRSWRGNRRD
jgi:hypothetical protein